MAITTTPVTSSQTALASNQIPVPAVYPPTGTGQCVLMQGGAIITDGNGNQYAPLVTQDIVAATGGSIPYHTLSAATTNATSVKTAACKMYGYSICNTNASARYVKFYDKASAPTVGTDAPKHTVQIPGNGTVIRALPEGMQFALGFGWATTVNVADSDTTAVAANDLVIDFNLNS